MAGRNRVKSGMSFTMEQLGLSKGEILPTPVLQPTYPMLDRKPLPVQITTEMSYLVELKRDFTEYMRESSNNVQAIVVNEDIERYCENCDETITNYDASEYESNYNWSRMPMELKSLQKRKIQQQSAKPSKKRKIKELDIETKLVELEKEEDTQHLDIEEEVEEGEEDEDQEEKINERVKDEEEIDEEMDDGTDYANEYFDTGENYYSEDDNDDAVL